MVKIQDPAANKRQPVPPGQRPGGEADFQPSPPQLHTDTDPESVISWTRD